MFASLSRASVPLRSVVRYLSTAAAPSTLVEAAKSRVGDASVVAPLAAAAAAGGAGAAPAAAAETLWAAAQLGIADAGVITALVAAAARAAPAFDAAAAGAAAWGAAALDAGDAAAWGALRAAARRAACAGVPAGAARQLLCAHHLGGERGGAPLLDAAGLAACAAALPAAAAGAPPAAAAELSESLSALGYEPQRVLALGGALDVPLLVGAKGLGLTAVEFAGPSAFLGVPGFRGAVPTGEARAHTRLLKHALGVSVISVPFFHWAALASAADRQRYLAARIQGSPLKTEFKAAA
jgi:hypothetical protein